MSSARIKLVLLLAAALAVAAVAVALAAEAEPSANAATPHGMDDDDARCAHMPEHCEPRGGDARG